MGNILDEIYVHLTLNKFVIIIEKVHEIVRSLTSIFPVATNSLNCEAEPKLPRLQAMKLVATR